MKTKNQPMEMSGVGQTEAINKSDTENQFMGMSDIGQAEAILNKFRRDYPSDNKGAVKLLDDLLEALNAANPLIGAADDFHNFAVSVSKLIDDNKVATEIVKKGLKNHPYNTDLLADAINYGYSGGAKQDCKTWFEVLNTIDKSRWTWRAFSFSIDYLLEETVSSISADTSDYTIEDILTLAKDYQEMISDNEDAWLCEYEIYAEINQKQKGMEALETALAKFKYCPRCWLRYADIMIDNGEYEKAYPILKMIIRNPKSGENVNMSYVYFLNAQCQLYYLRATEEYENGQVDENTVQSIYRMLHKSLSASGLRESVKNHIYEYIKEIEADSGLSYPEEWR